MGKRKIQLVDRPFYDASAQVKRFRVTKRGKRRHPRRQVSSGPQVAPQEPVAAAEVPEEAPKEIERIDILSVLADNSANLVAMVLDYLPLRDIFALKLVSHGTNNILSDELMRPRLLKAFARDVVCNAEQQDKPIAVVVGPTPAFVFSANSSGLYEHDLRSRHAYVVKTITKTQRLVDEIYGTIKGMDSMHREWTYRDDPLESGKHNMMVVNWLSVAQKKIFLSLDRVLKTPMADTVGLWMKSIRGMQMRINQDFLDEGWTLRQAAKYSSNQHNLDRHDQYESDNTVPHKLSTPTGSWLSVPRLSMTVARLRTGLSVWLARWLLACDRSTKAADDLFPLVHVLDPNWKGTAPDAYSVERAYEHALDVDALAIVLYRTSHWVLQRCPKVTAPHSAVDCCDSQQSRSLYWWSLDDRDAPEFAQAIRAWAPSGVIEKEAPREHVDMLFAALARLVKAYGQAPPNVHRNPQVTGTFCEMLIECADRLCRSDSVPDQEPDPMPVEYTNYSDPDLARLMERKHLTTADVMGRLSDCIASSASLWLMNGALASKLYLVIRPGLTQLYAAFVNKQRKYPHKTLEDYITLFGTLDREAKAKADAAHGFDFGSAVSSLSFLLECNTKAVRAVLG
ncbi:hypothetical protein ml_35 [Mollivirus sibericum]|uniref:hypothetical protein n=1 Tax=Mollivirus sibericum TaxID=1678078 RepID=UPI0006B2E5EB|nr:hypothetical protein ml_35 [Mollivirus sibericum]ALD61837.1 hypothetical protein ml_35 [Mollivirus sibericum]